MCEMACQIIQKKQEEKRIVEEQAANALYWKIPACCDDDDDYNSAITPNEPIDSLSMGDEHLNTILATESDEFIKSCVENLVLNPRRNHSEEEIIPMKIDPHHFNAESDLIESMLNHDSSIISSSSKIDSLLDEFAGELILLKSIPPGIDKTDCYPKDEIRFTKRLLYDNSSPLLPEEFVSENSNTEIESFSPSPIPVEDSDSFMEEIDLTITSDDPMPPSIEDDDDDSERDILILEEFLSNYSLSLPENESFHFDIPSFSRPSAKPPDGNTGILNIKMMGDNSKQKFPIPGLMITRVSNQEKSPDLLSHRGLKIFQLSSTCPMMIHGKNIHILDIPLFYFYPLDQLNIPGNLKTLAKGFYPPSLHFLSFNWESYATDDSPAIPEHTIVETPMNMSPKNKAHFESDQEAFHQILTGIGDEIYSTVDAFQTAQEMWEAIERLQQGWRNNGNMSPKNKAHFESDQEAFHQILTGIGDEIYSTVGAFQTAQEMWEAIERLQQGESFNIQDVKTNLFWEFAILNKLKGTRIWKNLALIAKYFKKIYKPTNNNLRTSSNSRNKNVDTTPRYKNDNQSRKFRNQRTMNVAGARENAGSPVVQQFGIQCFNYKEFGHFAKECKKPKRVKDSSYHKEMMLLCKQAEQGIPLQAEQYDWLVDMDEEVVKQELESHYSYMAKIQENDQNDVESDDERVALANLKLDDDENKKIQKQLKKVNTTLAQELKECQTILAKTSKSLGESISIRDSCLVALQNKQTAFEKYKAFNDRTIDYDKLERLVKQKTKVITDLKLKEEHDIDKMLSMEKQFKFLNEIVYKRSQSIRTIHMMAPKVPTYNGRPTFANPRYLKQAQSKIPCLYAFPYEQSTHANRLIPDEEETLALERESRSKLNKDLVRPYDYTTLNSLYEIFKLLTQEFEIQLAHAIKIQKKMWRKSFVKYKPDIFKNIGFLPVSKSISKSRQAYNVMTNNINHFIDIVDNACIKHSKDQFRVPTAQDMEILIHTCLMSLALKTQNDSFIFVHELKQEMHVDLKTVKNDTVWNEQASNVFQKEREQYIKIQDLKAQVQDKNIPISELKKLIEKGKGKYVETKFDKPSVVQQPNAHRIPKPLVSSKPTPFSNSLKKRYFSKTKSVPKTNVLEGLSKPVTAQTLP
nr:hypothetical protein [Tanacetum cinerariifolium]